MSQEMSFRKPALDWLTVVAIAAIAISFTVGLHEGVHAMACLVVGGDLQEVSALYESCDSANELQAKAVAGSAPIYNLLAGSIFWLILRRSSRRSSETQFFVWLFMMMNWFYGAGYFIFSGISNVGDWAVVVNGWEPNWLWRVLMTIVGTLLYVFFVRQGLKEFGMIVGGKEDEQIRRTNTLFLLSYFTSLVVVLMAGLFCPYGFLSLPVTAGFFAAAGALSPLIWMIRWFRTGHFVKPGREPLEIRRKWQWIATGTIVTFAYIYVLGRTIYF